MPFTFHIKESSIPPLASLCIASLSSIPDVSHLKSSFESEKGKNEEQEKKVRRSCYSSSSLTHTLFTLTRTLL